MKKIIRPAILSLMSVILFVLSIMVTDGIFTEEKALVFQQSATVMICVIFAFCYVALRGRETGDIVFPLTVVLTVIVLTMLTLALADRLNATSFGISLYGQYILRTGMAVAVVDVLLNAVGFKRFFLMGRGRETNKKSAALIFTAVACLMIYSFSLEFLSNTQMYNALVLSGAIFTAVYAWIRKELRAPIYTSVPFLALYAPFYLAIKLDIMYINDISEKLFLIFGAVFALDAVYSVVLAIWKKKRGGEGENIPEEETHKSIDFDF